MKVLFLLDRTTISSNFRGGGSARFEMYIRALDKLNADIYVLRFMNDDARREILKFEEDTDSVNQKEIRSICRGWTDLDFDWKIIKRKRFIWVLQGILNPVGFVFQGCRDLRLQLNEKINNVDPDLIWANHWTPGGMMTLINPRKKLWVYSHHDWLYKLDQIRSQNENNRKSLRRKIDDLIKKKAECCVAQKAPVVISGSATEAESIRKLGSQSVYFIPTLYDAIPNINDEDDSQLVRIIHLGGMKTTANRIGLNRYLDIVHPAISQMLSDKGINFEFWVVGDLAGADENLLNKIKKANAITPGFVKDLEQLFRPFDLSIIPYEHNTGNRTRVPLLFAYSQVLVAITETMKGFPFAQHMETAALADSINDMTNLIVELIVDRNSRKKIGMNARSCYEKNFTLDSQLPVFQKIMEKVG